MLNFKVIVFRLVFDLDDEASLEMPVLFTSLRAAKNYIKSDCLGWKYRIVELSKPVVVSERDLYD